MSLKKWPTFKLQDDQESWQTLKTLIQEHESDFILFYFYPKAMTPGCTTQACGLRDSHKDYTKQGCLTVGISPDLPARLQKFRIKEKLNFPLLSDPDFSLAKAVEAFGPKKFMGKSYEGILRMTFIVNKSGKILFHAPKVNTKTHHQDMLKVLQELNAHAD